MITTDPYNLHRFLGAQESFYVQALKEIRNGCKTSHWIWFIFPQVYGLGHSPMSDNYGIRSLDEARAISMTPFLNLALSKSLPHYCGIRKAVSFANRKQRNKSSATRMHSRCVRA